MVRFIMLHGEISGSAKIVMRNNSVEIKLSLRSGARADGLTLFASDGEKIKTGEFSSDYGIIISGIANVFGIILRNEYGEIVSEGSCGLSGSAMDKFKASVRMMKKNSAVQQKKTPVKLEQKSSPARADVVSDGKHESIEDKKSTAGKQSPVTAQILQKASYLFGESVDVNERFEVNQRDIAVSDEEAVQNPFPRMFPNSYWRRKIGNDTSLFGNTVVRGIKYSLTAIKSHSKYPPRELGRNVRRVLSTDGKRYWIGIQRTDI